MKGERRLGLWLTAPSFLMMILVTAYPLGYAVVLSLYNYRLTGPGWTRVRGAEQLLGDPARRRVVERLHDHLIITVVTVAIELVVGFIFAYVMLRIIRGRGPLRTAILIPYGIVTVVSAFIWRYAFALDSGFVNQWFGLTDFNWFGDRWSALFVICLSEIWKTTTVHPLLLLAGLVQVPEDMQEAAKVDGAPAWQRLVKVTLPNMKAAIMVALLFRTLDAWRIFDNLFVMTRGAKQHGNHLFFIYRQNDIGESRHGLAISVLLFLSVVAIAWVFVRDSKPTSQVQGD